MEILGEGVAPIVSPATALILLLGPEQSLEESRFGRLQPLHQI